MLSRESVCVPSCRVRSRVLCSVFGCLNRPSHRLFGGGGGARAYGTHTQMRLAESGLSGNKARKLYALNKTPASSFPEVVASHGGPQASDTPKHRAHVFVVVVQYHRRTQAHPIHRNDNDTRKAQQRESRVRRMFKGLVCGRCRPPAA